MLLRTEKLSKTYGTFNALKNLSMEIDRGSIVGFIGPNGAGKTTAMRIIATLQAPSSGEVYINDQPIGEDLLYTRKCIGFVPDYFGVYYATTCEEYLDFYADAFNIPKSDRPVLIDQMLELVNLSEKKKVDVSKLSRGMKQRLCLARALLNDPDLLVLDEPASGLDPQARAELKYILRALKNNGKSVLISSHILPELGEFCDKVVILNKGRKVAEGSMEEISNSLGEKLRITIGLIKEDDFEIAAEIIKKIEFVGEIIRDGMKLEVEYNSTEEQSNEIIKALVLSGVMISTVERTKLSLEQLYLEVIGNEKNK